MPGTFMVQTAAVTFVRFLVKPKIATAIRLHNQDRREDCAGRGSAPHVFTAAAQSALQPSVSAQVVQPWGHSRARAEDPGVARLVVTSQSLVLLGFCGSCPPCSFAMLRRLPSVPLGMLHGVSNGMLAFRSETMVPMLDTAIWNEEMLCAIASVTQVASS